MITATWIISIMAIIVFLAGLIAVIVVKTEVTTNWRKIGLILIWVIGLLIFRMTIWAYINSEKRTATALPQLLPIIKQPVMDSSKVTKTTISSQCYWYWKLPAGQYIRGRNEAAPDERTLKVVTRTDREICLDLNYQEYGQWETMRIQLFKTGERSWEGTWRQNNPQDGGRLEMSEIVPGAFGGDIVWQRGKGNDDPRGRCEIKF